MSKIYLCGITNKSEYKNIEELTDPIWEHIDGLIFGYDSNDSASLLSNHKNDECFNLLEERSGEGAIITRLWTNDHDLQMNTFLREGPLKAGDWFILRDSMERFNPEWAKELPKILQSFEMQGIRSVFNYGKGFAFQWNDSMIFQGSPHWGLQGAQMNTVDLKNMYDEDKKEHTWRIKDGEKGGRPIDNKIDHEAKYAWCYGRSNHLLLGLEDSIKEYQRAELVRLHVRDVALVKGFEHTLSSLKDFMIWFQENDLDNFKAWINSHRVWKNFYRYRVVGKESFDSIEKTENEWRYE